MTTDIDSLLKQADALAMQARTADLAGDHARAERLRAEFDNLWTRIENLAKAVEVAA